LRILVVDAGSTDGTLRRIRARASEDARIVPIEAGTRLTTPQALNLALEHAEGELFARVDAHGWPLPGYLRRAVSVLLDEGPDVACVGGRAEPVSETRFGRALGLAWRSRFGVGGSVYAHQGEREDVTTVPWGLYRRDALADVGGFDPSMVHGEDEELNWRLRAAGKRVVLDGGVRFAYVNRGSWPGAFRQYRDYGAARVRVLRKHPDFLRPHHLAPAALIAAGAAVVALAPFSGAARRALVAGGSAYALAAAAAAAAATQAADGERELVPDVMAAYAALHLGYGAGMLGEALSPRPSA
jgi:succinoglycan biosynthesis protein ExoA